MELFNPQKLFHEEEGHSTPLREDLQKVNFQNFQRRPPQRAATRSLSESRRVSSRRDLSAPLDPSNATRLLERTLRRSVSLDRALNQLGYDDREGDMSRRDGYRSRPSESLCSVRATSSVDARRRRSTFSDYSPKPPKMKHEGLKHHRHSKREIRSDVFIKNNQFDDRSPSLKKRRDSPTLLRRGSYPSSPHYSSSPHHYPSSVHYSSSSSPSIHYSSSSSPSIHHPYSPSSSSSEGAYSRISNHSHKSSQSIVSARLSSVHSYRSTKSDQRRNHKFDPQTSFRSRNDSPLHSSRERQNSLAERVFI
ncbi:serine/arginine repetitive matrix protein 4-like [Condylostylus longicornis]|uniref:serine/arginine repetitive matrix protein 4-like n=1 Tax=Condylostylus longicornis TaxID=2530218 RepID=UPI00244DEDCD|nr:serine/arginine repetitive matrix protein 4-like [Condylostylus longicornis]